MAMMCSSSDLANLLFPSDEVPQSLQYVAVADGSRPQQGQGNDCDSISTTVGVLSCCDDQTWQV